MENRLGKTSVELQESLTGQIGKAIDSIGNLNLRVAENEKRLDRVVESIEDTVERKVEKGLRRIRGLQEGGNFQPYRLLILWRRGSQAGWNLTLRRMRPLPP